MIHSMTGFGRATFQVGPTVFEVEIRSVNHRHLDARAKLPKGLSGRDAEVKAKIQARLSRGKVDCTVSVPGKAGGALQGRVEISEEVAAQYVAAARDLANLHRIGGELEVATLMAMPGVMRIADVELPEPELVSGLDEALDEALAALEAMRAAEGASLGAEFEGRLVRIIELVEQFEARSGLVVEATRARLRKRAEQLKQEFGHLDDARLHQEIVMATDRLDITEELVRLRSHVDQFRAILDEAGVGSPVGRRLDFLLQEMGREANTVGSKANDAPLAHDVVELKTELERLREQVQNVE